MEYNTKIIDYGDYLHIQHYLKGFKRVDFPDDIQKEIDRADRENIITEGVKDQEQDQKKIEHCLSVSVNRSKNNLFYIARSNHWDLFCTFTFDQNGRYTEAVDSSDYNLCSSLVTKFFSSLKRKMPDMIYLVVPELHSDKIHYHYHALIGNCSMLDLEFSGHYDNDNEPIYNILGWRYGFSTATFIKDQGKVRNYIGKYITKELMNKLKYKKRYYASQNVKLCEEKFENYSLDDLYDLYGEDIAFIKTAYINGFNRVHYMEIKK